jgi:hypothetical protein
MGGASLERDGSVHVLIENVGQPQHPHLHHPSHHPQHQQQHQNQIKRSVIPSSGRGRAHPAGARF